MERMDDVAFDALTRRAPLMTLGAAGLAVIASPASAGARKRGKKKRKHGDVFKRCKQQVGRCTAFMTILCDGDPECQDTIACCSFFGKCDSHGFLICFIDSLSSAMLGRIS